MEETSSRVIDTSTHIHAAMGFTCQICEGAQEIKYHKSSNFFQICDKCKAAIKQVILKQQQGLI